LAGVSLTAESDNPYGHQAQVVEYSILEKRRRRMVDIPTRKALEILPEWQSMELNRRLKLELFIDLLANGDVRAREIVDGICNGEIRPEDALNLLDEYLKSKH